MALDALGLLRNGKYAAFAVCSVTCNHHHRREFCSNKRQQAGKLPAPQRGGHRCGALIRDRALRASESADG